MFVVCSAETFFRACPLTRHYGRLARRGRGLLSGRALFISQLFFVYFRRRFDIFSTRSMRRSLIVLHLLSLDGFTMVLRRFGGRICLWWVTTFGGGSFPVRLGVYSSLFFSMWNGRFAKPLSKARPGCCHGFASIPIVIFVFPVSHIMSLCGLGRCFHRTPLHPR